MPTNKITTTLQSIKNDESLTNHFFKKLAVASNPLEWLIPLRDSGYFDPTRNPRKKAPDKKGYYFPHRNVLDALENMAVKNEETPNDDVSKILLEIVEGIITCSENGKRIVNTGTDWKMLETISHFPIEYIGIKHIQFIKNVLITRKRVSLFEHEIGQLFLPKLITGGAKNLIIELLELILHYSLSESGSIREYVPVIDSYYLKKALDKNKKGISEICAIEAANVSKTKILEILKEDKSQFNYIWIPTIEDHEQTSFPDRYECQLVHFVRDMLEAAVPKDIESIVKEMLVEEHDILKRLAYHLINHHYDALSHLLWNISYNPLNILTIHELYELFKAHCKSFDETQIETILNWIEKQDFYFSDEASGIAEKEKYHKAYYKKEWLLALLDTDIVEVKQRYEAYNSINDIIIDHPGFHSWSSGFGFVQDVSPIDEEKLEKMTNIEIAAYINSYKEKDEVFREDNTRINLAPFVRKLISNDSIRFSSDLTPFLSVPRKYQNELLRGFEEAWKNNKDINWENLLLFMKELIDNSSFWKEEKNSEVFDYNRWIADTIANLIQEGTRNDKHAFSPNLLPAAEEILLLLLKNNQNDMDMVNDLVTSVLNSSKGQLFSAAITYSLRYARVYMRTKEDRWIETIKCEFTERLDKTKEPGLEFSIVIGGKLPYLSYLDKQWVNQNFNRIFDLESPNHWEAAFTGYLMMTSTVYEEIYILLRTKGHYEKGLLYSFRDKHTEDKLIQNIAIGFLAGWDDLTDKEGLMIKLLETDNSEYLSKLVTYIWSSKKNIDEKLFRSKIKPLWGAIVKIISPKIDQDKYNIIASNLACWLTFVDLIDDDIYNWLQISVKVIEANWNSAIFLEDLRKHVVITPKLVGNLYLIMLNTGNYPDYNNEDIKTIVQELYNSKENETANRICNLYHLRGFEFLREIFEKNNL